MTSEWPLAGVFPDVTGKMLAPCEDHAAIAEPSALEHGDIATAFGLLAIGILWRAIGLKVVC